MKRAAAALAALASQIASGVGLEGTFLIIGTTLLAIGSSLIHPAGPWIVVGAVCLLVTFALAQPRRP